MKILIECEEEVLGILQNALDLYSRLLMGQWGEISNVISNEGLLLDNEKRVELEKGLKELRDMVLEDLKGYEHYGISNEKTPEASKIAYELYGVIRHELYNLRENKQRYGVDAYPPLKCSKIKLSKVKINREGGKE